MRFAPAILGTARVPSDDVDIDGVTIPAGTFVGLTTAAANRDPEVFPDPDRFDVTRSSTQPMLTFGGGIHYCLGVHLAKAELVEALTILTQRWATVRVTGPSPWKPVNGITGPSTLPIEVSLAG
jgi:cytochrome P450